MTFLCIPLEPVERRAERVLTGSEFARMRLGFQPDAQQAAVLDSVAKRGMLNCSRQWGKSTVCAIKAVHRALTVPGALVLVASPTQRQSAEFLRKAKGFAARLRVPIRGDGDNALSLLFPNGSRIVGLPGRDATVRGFSAVSLLVIDEAAYVDDRMYRALRPMLVVSDGDLWLMSTPAGQRGFFYEEWMRGTEAWERISVPATECARIRPEVLERERRSHGEAGFAQEYLCEFVGGGAGWYGREMVNDALSDDVPLTPGR